MKQNSFNMAKCLFTLLILSCCTQHLQSSGANQRVRLGENGHSSTLLSNGASPREQNLSHRTNTMAWQQGTLAIQKRAAVQALRRLAQKNTFQVNEYRMQEESWQAFSFTNKKRMALAAVACIAGRYCTAQYDDDSLLAEVGSLVYATAFLGLAGLLTVTALSSCCHRYSKQSVESYEYAYDLLIKIIQTMRENPSQDRGILAQYDSISHTHMQELQNNVSPIEWTIIKKCINQQVNLGRELITSKLKNLDRQE